MEIKLTNDQRITLANYLAEQRKKKASEVYVKEGLPFDEAHMQKYFKQEFEYYYEVLNETDDY